MNWLVMICFVDLPNLTSITSVGDSFYNPREVTLESIFKYRILILFRYSKSSKDQSTWFIPGNSIEINIEYSLIDWIWFIDVSSILADIASSYKLFVREISFDSVDDPSHVLDTSIESIIEHIPQEKWSLS